MATATTGRKDSNREIKPTVLPRRGGICRLFVQKNYITLERTHSSPCLGKTRVRLFILWQGSQLTLRLTDTDRLLLVVRQKG